MKPNPKTFPWYERSALNVAEAAAILQRSRTWVRNKLVSGALDAVPANPGDGPVLIDTQSVTALMDRLAANTRSNRDGPKTRREPRPTLRLVIDNTK